MAQHFSYTSSNSSESFQLEYTTQCWNLLIALNCSWTATFKCNQIFC